MRTAIHMDQSFRDLRRMHRIEGRAEALRSEAERWQALWDEAHTTTYAATSDPVVPVKPRRRWLSTLALLVRARRS